MQYYLCVIIMCNKYYYIPQTNYPDDNFVMALITLSYNTNTIK